MADANPYAQWAAGAPAPPPSAPPAPDPSTALGRVTETLPEYMRKGGPIGDVVDAAKDAWKANQDAYTQEVHAEDSGDLLATTKAKVQHLLAAVGLIGSPAAAVSEPIARLLYNLPKDPTSPKVDPELRAEASEFGGGVLSTGPIEGAMRLPGLARTQVGRVVSGAEEAANRFRMSHGYEPGAPPTPEMRAKAQTTGRDAVSQLAKRLDPTGDKLKFNPREARGKPVTAAEALGRPAETTLKVAGRRAGQTPDALEAQLRGRSQETADRILDDFHKITGVDPAAAEGDFSTEMLNLRKKASPLYERAYAHTGVTNDTLTALMKRPSVKKAMANAYRIAAEEGRVPEEIGLEKVRVMRPATIQTSSGHPLMFPVEEEVEVRNPSMQSWDYIKRGLDDVIEGYRKNGRLQLDTEGRAAIRTLSELRGELTNPETAWGKDYGAALDAGGEPLRQEEAFHSAKKLMSGATSEAEFNSRIKGYTTAQMDALKAGIAGEMRNAARAGRQRLGDLATPAAKAKMERIFGKAHADEMAARIDDERFLMAHGQRMTPGIGSDTSETLLADKEQRDGMADLARGARHLKNGKIAEAILSAIGSPIVGAWRGMEMPMNEATRDVIGALLSMRPSELAEVLAKHGATPSEASHITALFTKAGLFKPAARAMIMSNVARLAGGMGAGKPKGSDQPVAPSPAPAPAGASPPASDDSNPYAKFKTGGHADAGQSGSTPQPASNDDIEPAAFTSKADMSGYLEQHLGVPVRITSSFRSAAHNAAVGGAPGSAHMRGEAWDFVPDGMSNEEAGIALANSGIPFDQIEITPSHVHVSFDPRNRGQVIHESM